MTSQDFKYILPCEILGDNYDPLIASAINEAKAASDNETMQKNIVSFRYWEAVANVMMTNPASRTRGPISDSYSPDQLKYFKDQLEIYRSAVNGLLIPITANLSSGGAVLVEAI
jgi:hypothetical protein